ncbi:MAG: NAD(P)/FAD-dependent oxidoreductase [Bdellovibrionales bacterium]|nr:NAD(P)/FAD-dependent oxidoreductase [Bdellovibrionales bacterium]
MTKTAENTYDVIIIGSGMGGLTCASLLSQLASKRVLILEQHFKAGGYTHTFRRPGGFHWDVGIHYIGEMKDGAPGRKLMDFVTGGGVSWKKMNDPFERFVYPGLDFGVRSGKRRYLADLIEQFPEEEAALRTYFEEISAAVQWPVAQMIAANLLPSALATPVRILAKLLGGVGARQAFRKTSEYYNAKFKNPKLRALLLSQWGDQGLPPDQSALVIQAMVVAHYFQGGYYPVGGAAGIADSVTRIVKAAGGEVRLKCRAEEILIEGNRAVGVRVMEKVGKEEVERRFYANQIVSNVGAEITYRRLLSSRPEAEPARQELSTIARGPAHVNLFISFKDDPRKLGFQGENHWIYDGYDHDEIYARQGDVLEGKPHFAYVTFPSIKDPAATRHTGEIITFVPYEAFEKWRDGAWKRRGEDYETLKKRIADSLIAFVEERHPGYRDLIQAVEVSTPVTTEHFAAHPHGVIYGVAARPERYRMKCMGVRTPFRGLYQGSADTMAHGIMGATWGGVISAAAILGGFFGLLRTFRAIAQGPRLSGAAPSQEAPGLTGGLSTLEGPS